MANIVIKRSFNANAPITVEALSGFLFTQENQAHVFEIDGISSGSATGYFIAPDGTTKTCPGTVSGGKASVTLSQDCYNDPGRFKFAILNSTGGVSTCIYAAVGNVYRTKDGDIYDSGEVVPSLNELLGYISDCQQATTAAREVIDGSVRFDIAQTLTETQKAQARANIDGASVSDVNDLESALSLTNDGYSNINTLFAHGYISTSTGSVGNVVTSESYKYQAVTSSLIVFNRDVSIKCNSGYEFLLFYYDNEGTYVSRSGSWRNADTILSGTYFRVFIRLSPADTSANVDVNVFANNIYTDSELSYRIGAVVNDEMLVNSKIAASNAGRELIDTGFAHGRIMTTTGHVGEVSVSVNNYKYQAVTPDTVMYAAQKTIRANPGYAVQIWWYDDNDAYVGRSANFGAEFTLVANRRYRFFMRLDPADTSANVDVNVFQDNIFLISEVGEQVVAIEEKPLTTLPDYMLNNMAEKPLGILSKGYILLSFDDGAKTLATGTIPLLIENNVPGTFGLLPESAIFASGNESELATVVDAVENHGCVVAMHGSAQWPTYTESAMNAYFDSTIALFIDNDLGDTYGAICPGGNGDDTSTLVKAVVGGKFGYVFSGNRADKISYDIVNADGKYNGARSNRFDLDRRSGIGITTAKAHDIVTYAAENHLLLCPFWHDSTLNDSSHPEYITYFNNLIIEAKAAGLTFITTKDLPNIT